MTRFIHDQFAKDYLEELLFEILARYTHRRGRPQGFAPTDIYGTIFEKGL
jgi:hypothetical protein